MTAGAASRQTPGAALIAAYVAAYCAAILVGSRFYPELSTTGWVYLGLAGVGLILFRDDFRVGLALWAKRPLTALAWTFGGLVGAAVLSTAAALVPYALDTSELPNVGRVFALVEQFGLVFAIVTAGVAGPAVEEVVYRLVLVGRVSTRVPTAVCVPASAVVFASIHLGGTGLAQISAALPHFAIGLVLAVVYSRTRNITIPVSIHVALNLQSLATVAANLP